MFGCAMSLVLALGLWAGYWHLLASRFSEHFWETFFGSGFVALITFFCIGAILNALKARRDLAALAGFRAGLPRHDGQWIAACGTIHAAREPVVSPISGASCVLYECEIGPPGNRSDGGQLAEMYFAGFRMNPCVVRTPQGDVRILGFPDLDQVEGRLHVGGRARQYLQSTTFEDISGLKIAKMISALGQIWADEDGFVERHFRRQAVPPPRDGVPEEDLLDDDEDDLFDDDNDEEDDEETVEQDDSLPDAPSAVDPVTTWRVVEKCIPEGAEVCVFGRFDDVSGGLVPQGSSRPNRLLLENAANLEKKLRTSQWTSLAGGILVLLVMHLILVGLLSRAANQAERATTRRDQPATGAMSAAVPPFAWGFYPSTTCFPAVTFRSFPGAADTRLIQRPT